MFGIEIYKILTTYRKQNAQSTVDYFNYCLNSANIIYKALLENPIFLVANSLTTGLNMLWQN